MSDAKNAGKTTQAEETITAPAGPKMRVFLVIAHEEPHQRSFCHAIFRKTIQTLKLNGHEVMTLDLYESEFTRLPCLDDFTKQIGLSYAEHQKEGLYKEEILRCQACVEWCTHLIVFTPMHWLSPSAALMGWWEKVFGEGWAYINTSTGKRGFMQGKKAMAVVTCGMPQSLYGPNSVHITVEELMMNLTYRCFAKCGFTPLRTQAFFGLQTADPQQRVDMLNSWGEHVMRLAERPTIDYILSDEGRKNSSKVEIANIITQQPRSDVKLPNHKLLQDLGDYSLVIPKDPYSSF